MTIYPVSLRACPSYEPEVVSGAVAAILSDLGGIESFVAPGQTVLLKPNLLAGEPPERAVTTHPAVVAAVAAAFRRAGAEIILGDSPGIGSCRVVAEKSGVAAAVLAVGGSVSRFDRVTIIGRGGGRRFQVAAEVGRADLVVNLPKLKTHGMMVLTGAVKNLFGCLVGLRKPGYHLECQGTAAFAGLLLDLADAVAPGLSIMDAVVAMDGPGPRNGRPRQAGVLIGARDPLALDFIAAELVGVAPSAVPCLRLAMREGRAQADPRARRVVGDDPSLHRVHDFRLPVHLRTNTYTAPAFLLALVRRNMTAWPTVRTACTGCGTCAHACPAGAIALYQGRARIERGKCIRCYCCDEMCPRGAIALRRGLLAHLWPWG